MDEPNEQRDELVAWVDALIWYHREEDDRSPFTRADSECIAVLLTERLDRRQESTDG